MNPIDWLTQLGTLGRMAGDVASKGLSVAAGNVFDSIMEGLWGSGLTVLRLVLEGIDVYSRFTVSTTDGPIGIVWPVTLWIGGMLALGLFFWQILSAVLRGGRGFSRLVLGPMQYCAALAASVGIVAALLAAADGLTTVLLGYGLNSDRFADALHAFDFPSGVSATLTAVILGVVSVLGTFPAGFGMAFEMVLRQAGVYVVVATIPILAAGLLANSTSRWFWKGARVLLALIFLKPGIALVVVVGVATMAGWQGLFGLLAGVVTFLIALFVPLVLFKLFSFIDPNAGGLRDEMSGLGADSYGADSVPGNMADRLKKAWQDRKSGNDDDEEGAEDDDAQETANDDRFDAADVEPDDDLPDSDGQLDEEDDDGDERDDEHAPDEESGEDDEPRGEAALPDGDDPPAVAEAAAGPAGVAVPHDEPPDDDNDDDDDGPGPAEAAAMA